MTIEKFTDKSISSPNRKWLRKRIRVVKRCWNCKKVLRQENRTRLCRKCYKPPKKLHKTKTLRQEGSGQQGN